jgi:hypothetical protein
VSQALINPAPTASTAAAASPARQSDQKNLNTVRTRVSLLLLVKTASQNSFC